MDIGTLPGRRRCCKTRNRNRWIARRERRRSWYFHVRRTSLPHRKHSLALSSTVYNLDISLADVDRGVYESLALRVALHPSESLDYMLTRVLAYCLQYEEGILFSRGGISDPDEPPIRIVDPTGRITAWIEIGAPDAERLNKAAKAADRVAVYTHKNPAMLQRQYAGRRIHRAEEIPIYAFDRAMIEEAAQHLDRRTKIDLSFTGGQLYLSLGERSFSGAVVEHGIEG